MNNKGGDRLIIKMSERKLDEVLDFKELENLFKHFSNLTGVDVSLHDIEGNELLYNRLLPQKNICEYMKQNNKITVCNQNMAYSAKKSAELGEPYIFKCGCMIKCSAPILLDEKLIGSLSCGPVLLWDADDLSLEELENWAVGMEVSDGNLQEFLDNTKQLSCESMTSAAQMLSVMVDYMCREESKFLAQRLRISKQQKEISELLHDKKKNAASLKAIERKAKFRKFPIELERELIASVQVWNISNAKRILNDLLSEIFSFSSGNLDIIKAKLFELSAILIRAGVDGGAPLLEMSKIIVKYSNILSESVSFEELCHITTETMETIMKVIYDNRGKKPTNQHLINAIEYIKLNYDKDVSLETVAKNIYVSNYYLSHLFRDELNMTFSDYVNKIRMDESLVLMKTTNMTIQKIAEEVGINDANYFTKIFKRYYGVTPTNYLKLYK